MPKRGEHCPFLNRADDRCSANFSLDHLQHAFHHCFGKYHACPVYYELLAERRERRGESLVLTAAAWDDVTAAPGDGTAHHGTPTLVRLPQLGAQLGARISQRSGSVARASAVATPNRYAKSDAAGEVLSPAPRF